LRRLLLAYALLILVTGTVTGIAALRIHTSTEELELSAGVLLPLVAEIGELRALTAGTRTYLDQVDPEADVSDRLRSFAGSFEARRNALLTLSELEQARAPVAGTFPRQHLGRALVGLEALAKSDDRSGFLRLLDEVDRELRLVLVLARAEIKSRARQAARTSAREINWLIGLAALGALAVLILTLTLIAPLRSLKQLRQAVERVEEGQPVAPVQAGNDEVGATLRAVQRMAETVHKREQNLKDERSRLRLAQSEIANLIESVPQALVVLDPQGRVTRINQGCRRLFSEGPDQFVGKALSATPAGAVIDNAAAVLRGVLGGEEGSFQDEMAFGEGRRLAVHLSLLRDRDSSRLAPPITGAILVIEEVTRRFDAELSLRRHERLAAMGRLAAQVVHEIRNPLSTIGLAARMLGDDLPEGSDPEGWLDQIRSEAARLERVTQAYLQLARLPDPKPQETELAPLVDDLVRFLNDERLTNEVEPDLMAWVDPDGLRGALINLIQNALQAVDEKNGTVRLHSQSNELNSILIIDDDGPGIAEQVLERLGQAFIDGRPSGTGLGLALAVEVLADQGGRLEVSLRDEGGTRCCAILPKQSPST
jgi:nitrogen fixation/metabolism regulation signal transduction histidine kinase